MIYWLKDGINKLTLPLIIWKKDFASRNQVMKQRGIQFAVTNIRS